jgi:hypothetical protein
VVSEDCQQRESAPEIDCAYSRVATHRPPRILHIRVGTKANSPHLASPDGDASPSILSAYMINVV